MSIFDIILLSIGLGVDCFAVSISHSMLCRTYRWQSFLLMALLFGLFQGAMPLITFFAGLQFAAYVNHLTHWIALALLTLIGSKMIADSLKKEPTDQHTTEQQAYRLTHLLQLSVATSIDALASGILFISSPEKIVAGVIIIALGSFILSVAGSNIGYYLGNRFHFNSELMGGIILIGIGIKIFIEHYIAS